MHQLKDISVIIPTYNRARDLKETLRSVLPSLSNLRELIIADQSSSDETRKLIKSLKNSKIKYIHNPVPSITLARNVGVKKASSKSSIIIFLDDDVILGKNYFDEIIKVFNEHKDALAAAAYIPSPELTKMLALERILRKMFFISYPERDRARITGAYGNTYPYCLTKTINPEWLSGVNMAYKKEVFKEQRFDENLPGYTVAEDIGFSYKLYKKHPSSIFLTPYAKLTHRASNAERYPDRKMSYINQIDHFYFYFKEVHTGIFSSLKFLWTLLGISMLRILNSLRKLKKTEALKTLYFFESLFYCIVHAGDIKRGNVRSFLTD